MMHMSMWFGFDLGDFLFPGLTVSNRWSFALTWIALFFIALLYEGSKVYLANVQRKAIKRLHPFRSDERRNLLCDREQGNPMEPTTSRNASAGQVSRWASFRVRALVNAHQSGVFMIHNTVGYLLMLAVMIYNVHLLLAVVFGTMLGYFLFGTKLTRMQMQCFSTKRVVICTPECDDTAETSTPPLLDSPINSESDFFICRTRACIQPSHYFRANTDGNTDGATTHGQDGATSHGRPENATCYYGAKKCPSKVARAKKSECQHSKEDSPGVEDAQLLRSERQGCCMKKTEQPPDRETETAIAGHDWQRETAIVHDACCERERETTPQITCCNKSTSESREQIIT